MSNPQLLLATTTLVVSLLFLSPLTTTAQPPPPSFKCTTKSTCKSLIGYTPTNSTTLAHIQSLFQVKTLRSILGVNNLPLTTPSNYAVSSNQTVTIPFPCRCINGTGLSNRVPQYTVVKNDGLFNIASLKFGGLVADTQIQAVNHIKDINLIIIGQKLWIPLPCSCDDVEGEKVVHYGHVVADGSSVDNIAAQFGTTPQTLMNVNGIADPKKLMAGQVLDVPLKACSSSINSSSPDYPLLVANNTYVFTANNCVMCKCSAVNNFTLECHSSGLKPANWPKCPAAQCSSDMSLGNFTTISSCSQSTCAYTGYANQTILTNLVEQNTCTAPDADNNRAAGIHSTGWSLALVLLCIQLVLLPRFL